MAQAAGKRAKIGLSREIALCFVKLQASPERVNLCMVPPKFGDIAVITALRPGPSRWAVVLLAAAALALAGCGRKGALDLPPNAAGPVVEQGDTGGERAAAKGDVFDPSYGANELPGASKGRKKSFVLDPLLNSN
jgi:predicted small lipoprotein YifL